MSEPADRQALETERDEWKDQTHAYGQRCDQLWMRAEAAEAQVKAAASIVDRQDAELCRAHEANEKLTGALAALDAAAEPYMTGAAPHEELFSERDLRNFDQLAEAKMNARDALAALPVPAAAEATGRGTDD